MQEKVICGDVLNILPSLNEKFDLVFADPPFNMSKKYGKHNDSMERNEYLEWSFKWLKECVRLLKPSGTLVVYNRSEWLIEYGHFLNALMHFKSWIVWYASTRVTKKKALCSFHYDFLYYTKDLECYTYNQLLLPHEVCRKCGVYLSDWGGKEKIRNPMGKKMVDVWTDIARVTHNREKHPCQLPVRLLDRIIKMTTNKGDIILDPFSGTGTTAVSARRNERDFVVIDIEPRFVSITKKRLSRLRPKLTRM